MSAKDEVVRKNGRWAVRIVLPGRKRATTLSLHADGHDARVALAFWREDMHGEIEECVHRTPWHRCPICSLPEAQQVG